jgi:two-component system, LytTR family, response regulator LytT
MQVWIIEDEMLAAERLQLLLKEYDPAIAVTACFDSIDDTVRALLTRPHPDLMLLDIQLSDGYSFDIFKKAAYKRPVIFTTAFDNYAIDAFKLFSLDYILKPVELEALAAALNKYRAIAASFVPVDYRQMVAQLPPAQPASYKNRFLAKVGQRIFFVEAGEVSYFRADGKLVYLADKEGNRFIIDNTLDKLQAQLDPKEYFRLNRRYIVRYAAILHVRPYPNNRLKLSLKGAPPDEEMIVSRERVQEFKEWAEM